MPILKIRYDEQPSSYKKPTFHSNCPNGPEPLFERQTNPEKLPGLKKILDDKKIAEQKKLGARKDFFCRRFEELHKKPREEEFPTNQLSPSLFDSPPSTESTTEDEINENQKKPGKKKSAIKSGTL
ncbi:MAG: hypothetical protein V1822_04300 [Candidatus Micrarchaeota archaeon]